MHGKRALVLMFIALYVCIQHASGQGLGGKRTRFLKPKSDTLYLDSLSLAVNSVHYTFFNPTDSAFKPHVNYKLHSLIFLNGRPDSFFVSYSVFPFNFEKKYFHKNADEIYPDLSGPMLPFTFKYNEAPSHNQLLKNDGLTKNGNISRGVSVGNNQDAVLNSNLNLQVSGKLTPEIDLLMAATDNNIPFQADGTTAQLQEFDKVYIQLNNENSKLIVGDYQLSKPGNSYFMSYFKRAQGLYMENSYTDSTNKKPVVFKTKAAGAVSRGKFCRQVFFGTENNQGPYRLKGADNEPFIIVLSGTERIFIDGKQLMRGQENDYIIDYNTGEITFTAKQVITKDKRIVAEFQYAERNYARSLFFAGEEIQWKKASAFMDFYSEQDNKNRSLQQELSDDEKVMLSKIGDTLEKAYISGASKAVFNTTDVFYKKKDTIAGAYLYKNIYVYSGTDDTALYLVKFSYVGNNKGYYRQTASAANGRVYEWLAPVNNVLQGSYEPVILLVTPKQNQMLTAGVTLSVTPNNTLQVEGVYTKNDINTFSRGNKGNDDGSGVKITSNNVKPIYSDSSVKAKLMYNIGYEFVQKNFRQVERFRSIEFDRDWNRPLSGPINNDQHIGNVTLGYNHMNAFRSIYQFNTFVEGNNYQGIRHNVISSYQKENFFATYNGSLLNSQEQHLLTRFYRHKSKASQGMGKIKIAYEDVFENNRFYNDSIQSLLSRTYQFWEWEGSVSSMDTTKNYFKFFYRERRDKQAYSNEIKDSTKATNIGFKATVNSIKNHPFAVYVTYRELNLKNTVSTLLKPDNTLVNRIEYDPRFFNGAITLGLFYETGYGLENKKEYYYIEVAPGQGQYAWIDYNHDNVKQLNEFEISQFSDQAKYIRLSAPTNDYVKVLQNQVSSNVYIRPSVIFRNKEGKLKAFVSRFSFQTNFRTDSKTGDNGQLYYFNPSIDIHDTLLIANNNNFRQSVFFNQSSSVFGGDYTYINNSNKQLLNNGIEFRQLETHQVRWRVNFAKWFTVQGEHTLGIKGQQSLLFSTRNFLLHTFESEQKFSYQPNTQFKVSVSYKYSEKRNTYGSSNQTAFANTLGWEMRFNKAEKGSFNLKADMVNILYNDAEASTVAYEMLGGLSNGTNYTWELSYLRNINSNLQVSIGYNGRKTGSSSTIVHLGNGTIRAYF